MIIHPPRGCPAVTLGLPVPQVTTDLLSRGGKDIAFASYGPLWKFQRKLVHTALSMFGEGSLALERISKCLHPAPGSPQLWFPPTLCFFFLSVLIPWIPRKDSGSAHAPWYPHSLPGRGSVPLPISPVLYQHLSMCFLP